MNLLDPTTWPTMKGIEPMSQEVNAYCEPRWHDGAATPADFRVSVLIPSFLTNDTQVWEDHSSAYPSDHLGFSCCSDHLGRAVEDVTRRAAPAIEGQFTIRVRPAR